MQTSEDFCKAVRNSLVAVLICAAILFVCVSVQAQNLGTVGILAKMTPVFSAQAANGSSGGSWQCANQSIPPNTVSGMCGYLPDVGQGIQSLFFCNNNFSGTIDLEWTPNPTVASPTFYPVPNGSVSYTNDGPSSGTPICHQLPAGLYYPNLRSTVSGYSSGTVSAWYSEVSGPAQVTPAAVGSNGATSPISCDKTLVQTVTTGSTAFAFGPSTGQITVICGFTYSFAGATSTGTVYLDFYATVLCGGSVWAAWGAATTSSTPQTVSVDQPIRSPLSTVQDLCLQNSSGASVTFAISYASITQ